VAELSVAELSVRAVIEGKVQGVWFRAWTVEQARVHRLDGWVRNRPDGSVEALFSGQAVAVNQMLAACWQGPPLAKVTAVRTAPADPPQQTGFHQLPTG
jgi:acylphosphatase